MSIYVAIFTKEEWRPLGRTEYEYWVFFGAARQIHDYMVIVIPIDNLSILKSRTFGYHFEGFSAELNIGNNGYNLKKLCIEALDVCERNPPDYTLWKGSLEHVTQWKEMPKHTQQEECVLL